jgi:hypothetical protein
VHTPDKWIDGLPLQGVIAILAPDQCLELLDGDDQDQGREELHQQGYRLRLPSSQRHAVLLKPYGSEEFLAELAAVRVRHEGKKPHEIPGTWGALVSQYREHRLPQLEPRTQSDYQKVLDWLKPLHRMELSKWTRGFAIWLRDKALKKKGRRFANYVISVVQAVFTWALERELVDEHPIQKVKAIPRPKSMPRANRPWTRDEWNAVLAAAPEHLLAPMLLCGVLGWREGEVVNRPRDDYDRQYKKIKRVSAKSGRIVKTPVPKIISDALDALFLMTPRNCSSIRAAGRGRWAASVAPSSSSWAGLRRRGRWVLGSPFTVCATPAGRLCANSDSTRTRSPTCSGRRIPAWPSGTRATLIWSESSPVS